MAIIKFKTRKNIYSSKQLCRYVLTDRGRIKNPFEAPIFLQNVNRLELDTMHRDFLDNYKEYDKKRANGNALLHEIVAISKEDRAHITPEILQDMMYKYIELRGAENALVIAKSHDNQHIHFMISNNELRSSKTLRMSHEQMKNLLFEFEAWHRAKYPILSHSLVHTIKERKMRRDIASENRNNRREKEYALKMRTPGKKLNKELACEMVDVLLQKVRNFKELATYIKQTKELEVYSYRDKVRGVLYQSRKYRFSTLGITKERLLPLERHQKRLEELQLIKEMHQKTRDQSMERGR